MGNQVVVRLLIKSREKGGKDRNKGIVREMCQAMSKEHTKLSQQYNRVMKVL